MFENEIEIKYKTKIASRWGQATVLMSEWLIHLFNQFVQKG